MPEPFKNLINAGLVDAIAGHLLAVFPKLARERFVAVSDGFAEQELKQRVASVADCMRDVLPSDYLKALDLVVRASDGKLGEFGHWPYTTFVERHGLAHPTESLRAMETLTRKWSCEFAIRPFLEQHFEQTMTSVTKWTLDSNEHVRRLASEGTRPFLPWGTKVHALNADPAIGLRVLEVLRHDESETVRRSVANHLNDIAKFAPDLIAETLERWTSGAAGSAPVVDEWMVRHALRTMIKRGHHGAMRLLGFTVDAQVQVERFAVSPAKLALGGEIEMSAAITSTSKAAQRLVVDFVIHHPTASGSISAKVFKWTVVELEPESEVALVKRRKIQTASIRRYTAGTHRIDLQVAGAIVASTSFELTDSSPSPADR